MRCVKGLQQLSTLSSQIEGSELYYLMSEGMLNA